MGDDCIRLKIEEKPVSLLNNGSKYTQQEVNGFFDNVFFTFLSVSIWKSQMGENIEFVCYEILLWCECCCTFSILFYKLGKKLIENCYVTPTKKNTYNPSVCITK